MVGCLCGPGGDRLHEVIQRAVPVPGLVIADTPDDLLIYREWPTVPINVLTQVGPTAAGAYQSFVDTPQPLLVDLSKPTARIVDVESNGPQ